MSFFDLASTAISAGTTIWSTLTANAANTDAAEDYSDALLQAATLLNTAEDSALEEMLQGNADMLQTYQEQQSQGASDLDQLVTDYTSGVTSAGDDYTTALTTASAAYGDDIVNAASQYSTDQAVVLDSILATLTSGLTDTEEAYSSYLESGEDALAVLAQAMGRDPSQLTASQQALVADYGDQMRANLAASGLMGSGSAVAAYQDGQAALYADLYDSNQDQIDAAAKTLASLGYNASDSVASARETAAQTQANAMSSIGSLVAENAFNTAVDAAETYLNAEDKGYTASYNGLISAADLAANTASDSVARDDVYSGITAALQGSDASLTASALQNIAGNTADALTGSTEATTTADTTNASNTTNMYSTLASLVANSLKSA